MIITLSGYPGTHTKKLGKALSLELGLNFVSEEELGKESNVIVSDKESAEKMEEIIKEKIQKGKLVEGIIAPAIVKPELSVFLLSSEKNRAKNLAISKNISEVEAVSMLEELEENIGNAMLEAKGIDVFDLSRYDLVVSLEKIKDDGAIALVKKSLGELK